MTKGRTLVVGDQSADLGDQREDLGDQREDLSSTDSNKMQTGWAKPKKLPARPREKRPLDRIFSSVCIHIFELFGYLVDSLSN